MKFSRDQVTHDDMINYAQCMSFGIGKINAKCGDDGKFNAKYFPQS